MNDPLSALIEERSTLLRQVSELGDFQPGSISSPTRRCGKPGCHCAKPNDAGHGPHYLTRWVNLTDAKQQQLNQLFLLLKAQRMAVTKTEFVAFRKAA